MLMVGLLGSAATAWGGDRPSSKFPATRSEVITKKAMAATSHPLATHAALFTLHNGGNAIDAAIAANAVLGVVEPTGSGIGGDLFAIIWDAKTKKLYGLNASGRSPMGLTLQDFKDKGLTKVPSLGPLSVTVPGCVDGWFELHQRFGRLPMSKILYPAMRHAEDGFPVSELIAYYWAKGVDARKEFPNFASTYLVNGKAPGKGDIFKNPDLAKTYDAIARGGRKVFYQGGFADVISAFCERNGCYLRRIDFEEHKSTWVDPVSTNYRGYDVWELPPNTQGIAVLQMLNLLEPFALKEFGHNSPVYLHHLIEAKKIAFEDRARFYADPAFSKISIEKLISKEYAESRRSLILPDRAQKTVTPVEGKLMRNDTIYLTVADNDRNMVSLIQSNYRGFGSGLVPDGLGFCLQNRGELFSLEEGHPNVYEPGKRSFHTIIPGFVTKDDKPWLSFGVMGGDMQPQGHVQVLCNLIDFGMNLQEAGDAARFHHLGSSEPTGEKMTDGGWLALESGISSETVKKLEAMGHTVRPDAGGFGGYQAIMYDAERDIYIGASESRSDGHAGGY